MKNYSYSEGRQNEKGNRAIIFVSNLPEMPSISCRAKVVHVEAGCRKKGREERLNHACEFCSKKGHISSDCWMKQRLQKRDSNYDTALHEPMGGN